jgi:RHS repeat-associated protein
MAGISSKALKGSSYPENKYKFVSQELDDELGLNTYQFKFRTMDPQIGRFLQIDPLASQYVYNTTYAYAENRVTIGIDLEGKELYQTTTIAPDKRERTWNINIKVVNSDMSNSDGEVNQRVTDMKKVVASTFSGKDAQGYDVKVNVDAKVDECADFSKDFIMNFTHDLPGHPAFEISGINIPEEPDAAGSSDKIGDVTSNVMNVVSTDVFKGENGSDAQAHTDAAFTSAHELGHAGGLRHNTEPGNLMNSSQASYEGSITPQQRSIIGNTVPISQNKTILSSSMLTPEMKAFIPKAVFTARNVTVVN